MSADIVKRLREAAADVELSGAEYLSGVDDLIDEAADEIERLRVWQARYETLRLLPAKAISDAEKLAFRIGKPFDQIIDELQPFRGGESS